MNISFIASEVSQISRTENSGAVDKHNGITADSESFFAQFDDIWSKLLLLAKQLRDTMQLYNQKKQELGWELEVNTLKDNLKSIDDSYRAAKLNAAGGICAGVSSFAGVCGSGVMGSEVWMAVGNSGGQMFNGALGWAAGSKTRIAESEKAVADLQNKGAQSYEKTLDDTLMKAREIMQHMMDMGRNLVEVFSQVLRALSR